MEPIKIPYGRRNFIKTSAALTSGLVGLTSYASSTFANTPAAEESLFVIGPKEGYTPHIGTLVSMLNYNRQTIINSVKSMTVAELDYLHDPKANTIGALIMHLGATEKFYQANTFDGREEFNDEEKKMWGAAMSLGDEGRENIKGKPVDFYLNAIKEVRERTLTELKKKDDQWLMAVDPKWSRQQ